jgi:hypothetical protein
MSVEEAGKWLAAAILEQPLFSAPVYQKLVEAAGSDDPLLALTNVRKWQSPGKQNIDFRVAINPVLIGEILALFFDKGNEEANQISASCVLTLDHVVSPAIEDILYLNVNRPFSDAVLGKIFPPRYR